MFGLVISFDKLKHQATQASRTASSDSAYISFVTASNIWRTGVYGKWLQV
jgi:hypothetical protein